MTSLAIADGVLGDRRRSLLGQLAAWTAAAAMFAASPCLAWQQEGVSNYDMPVTAEAGLYQWHPHSEESGVAAMAEFVAADESLRKATQEIEIARRIIGAMSANAAPEVDTYMDDIEAVLNAMPVVSDLRDAITLTAGFSLARARLAAEVSTMDLWIRLNKAIDPGHAGLLHVPARFVKPLEVEPGAPLTCTEADLRVTRAINTFFASDANFTSPHT